MLKHLEKFQTLDNNQRVDALYQAIEAIAAGEITTKLGEHDHDTRYYPRQLIDQAQTTQDLRLAQLESGVNADHERDRKIASISDRVSRLEATPVATPLVPVVSPVAGDVASADMAALMDRVGALEALQARYVQRLMEFEQTVTTLAAKMGEQKQFLDALAVAAARDLKKRA